MTALAIHRAPGNWQAIVLPPPRMGEISIRQAVLSGGDVKFTDELQRKHARMVGWFPTKQLETYVSRGHVLIAESESERVGYVIAHDRYFKHDDCGIVYQLNVVPSKQRGLIGASLIKAVFDRAAYGCKLFCCWCAQDLEANCFWESIGFVPLAFRTGARKAGARKEPRIHIFWQRRIREGDVETPYWFPAETSSGALRENRLVLPIPPGVHWSDAKPAVLPGVPGMENVNTLQLDAGNDSQPREKKPRAGGRGPKAAKPTKPVHVTGGLWFAPPAPTPEEKKAAKAREPKVRFKNDPKLVAAARELRDRYLDDVNTGRMLPPGACGKYDVSRQLEAAPSELKQTPLLKVA